MKNLAAVVVFFIVLLIILKLGINQYLNELERHNKFLEDKIKADGLQYVLRVEAKDEDPSEEPAQAEEEPDPAPAELPPAEAPPAPDPLPAPDPEPAPDPNPETVAEPSFLSVGKVGEAAKVIFEHWNLDQNKPFIEDLKEKDQTKFASIYNKDILGKSIREQFGIENKKGLLYIYYKAHGVKKASEMSSKILIQLYKHARRELKIKK